MSLPQRHPHSDLRTCDYVITHVAEEISLWIELMLPKSDDHEVKEIDGDYLVGFAR